ncbi:MAG: hypothetical protein V1834_02835 [Candidatus Micrarchaeota archaeon]
MKEKLDSFHVFLKKELKDIRNNPEHEHRKTAEAVWRATWGYKNISSVSNLREILEKEGCEVDARRMIDALREKRLEQTTALVKGVKKASEVKAPERGKELELEEE